MKKKVINWKRNNVTFIASLVIILILSILFVLTSFTKKPSSVNGEGAFRKYIINPIPNGVTNFDADITEYQGSNIYISFTVDSYSTFQNILNTSKYKIVSCPESEFSKIFVTKKLNNWKTGIGSFECYEGGSENFMNKTLFFNKYTGDVIYNEIRL